MSDRIIALISSEHATKIVWDIEVDGTLSEPEDEEDESDRLFTFEVAKTNEQDENVMATAGFKAWCWLLNLGGG